MITYDNFPQSELENICEAENNAEVMKRFIDETSLTADIIKRKKAILHLWADYMNSFWDEGNDLNEKDHWKQQWEWGSEILDYMDEYISNQNTKKKIKPPSDGAIPDELFTNPDAVFENLLDDIKDVIDPAGDQNKVSKPYQNHNDNKTINLDNASEIHISGRIDNFLFGKIKDPYFEELEKSGNVFKDNKKNNQLFLESLFSLFLENNPFSEKTNLQLFEEVIDIKKFFQYCPNFYKIYLTMLPDIHQNKEVIKKDNELYLKSEEIRSIEYDHYSFLEEIIDSPSHLSQNTNPDICNQFRVFSPDLFIEIYDKGKKIYDGQLGKFLDLKNIQNEITWTDKDYNLITDKQKNALINLKENKYSYFDVKVGNIVSEGKHKSINYDNFWPIDYFKFTMGKSSKLLDKKYWFQNHEKHYQYEFKKEVRVSFANVSKCIFKFSEKIDFEKLLLLRCGSEEICRSAAINYGDDLNLFNFIAYDGKLIKPEETIFRDKGIDIFLSSQITQHITNNQPLFFTLFVD